MAILWDYDGTLVDSSRKNMEVTISIFRKFYPDIAANMPDFAAGRTVMKTARSWVAPSAKAPS